MLSSRTRRTGSRAAALLRLAAVTVGRTDTALGAFYRRLSARIGKAKAVTATARKIAALFYNAVRHGMEYVDPGGSFYDTRYRQRVVENLHRRAKTFLNRACMLVRKRAVLARVGVDLRVVQRDCAHLKQAHLARQQQDLNERRLDLL